MGFLGCSSSNSTPAAPAPDFISGQFAATTVEGLDYQTFGRSDATDATGTF